MARTSNLFYTPSPYEDSVVVVKKKTANDILLDSLGVGQKEIENMNAYVAQKKDNGQTAKTETKPSAKKEDPFLEGFDDPYGEKAEQERQRKEQERKERFAKIRENADKRTWVDGKVVEEPAKTDPFLEGFNGTSNEQRVKFPNTQLQSTKIGTNLKLPNTQLQTAPKNTVADEKFLEGFNDPYGEKEKEEKSKWQKVLDGISTGLTAASFIPGLDTFTNIAQIPVDLLRGDFVGAGLDLVGAIPFVGEIADIGKTARTADRIIDGVRATDKLVDGVKVIETVDDTYDAVKAVDATTDAAKAAETVKTIENVEEAIDLPHIKYPGDDPSIAPGKDFEWRGKYPPTEGNGAWYNPKTDESMHWDLNHKDPIGPHWDYIDSNGNFFRVFKDGRIELSKKGGKNR